MKKKKQAKKRTASTVAGKPMTKASFVLSLPRSMSAKEVLAKGKAAGIELSAAHVYAIRSSAKSKGKKSALGARTTNHVAGTSVSHKIGHSAEDLLRAVAAELGLPRAMSVLQTEHDRVRRLLGD